MNNVLILGSSGFIGSHLSRSLSETNNVIGYDIVDRRDSSITAFIKGDFCKETDFVSILNEYRIDTIYHLVSTSIPSENTENICNEISDNVFPTIRLMEAMKNSKAKKLIFASSGGTVYGECNSGIFKETDRLLPRCNYGIQKVTNEMYISLYSSYFNIQSIIARMSNPYGIPPQKHRAQGVIPVLLKCLHENKPITLYGNTTRDYIYIQDAVDALCILLNYNGSEKIFNISSGQTYSLFELINIIEEQTGLQFTSIIKKDKRKCDIQNSKIDNSLACRELSWKPQTQLSHGIDIMWKKITDK